MAAWIAQARAEARARQTAGVEYEAPNKLMDKVRSGDISFKAFKELKQQYQQHLELTKAVESDWEVGDDGNIRMTELALSTRPTAAVETVDLSHNRFDPSLLDGIKHKVKLNLAECRA